MNKEEVRKMALNQSIQLSDEELTHIADKLIPMIEERFEDMQTPQIEILKEKNSLKLKASYTFS